MNLARMKAEQILKYSRDLQNLFKDADKITLEIQTDLLDKDIEGMVEQKGKLKDVMYQIDFHTNKISELVNYFDNNVIVVDKKGKRI